MRTFLLTTALVVAGATSAVAGGLTNDGVYNSKWTPVPTTPVATVQCR